MLGNQPRSGTGRRTLRERKISQRMAVVDDSARQQAVQARLDALEADNEVVNEDPYAVLNDSGDEEFFAEGDSDDENDDTFGSTKKKKKKVAGGKRKTRGAVTGESRRGVKSLARLIEVNGLERLPPGTPSYLSAAAAPPSASAARKFCSVCGNASTYSCARCGSRYCCRRCYMTHTETRCLKFMS